MSDTKTDKCPGCLPDVRGAYFSRDYVYNDESDSWMWVWKCNNCGWTLIPIQGSWSNMAGALLVFI